MKKLLSIVLWLCAFLVVSKEGQGQQTFLRGDTVFILKAGGNAEFVLLNATKTTKGFLYNPGGGSAGKTYFKQALVKLNDSMYVIGGDTLKIGASIDSAFSKNDLTANGNRFHNWNRYTLEINNSSKISLLADTLKFQTRKPANLLLYAYNSDSSFTGLALQTNFGVDTTSGYYSDAINGTDATTGSSGYILSAGYHLVIERRYRYDSTVYVIPSTAGAKYLRITFSEYIPAVATLHDKYLGTFTTLNKGNTYYNYTVDGNAGSYGQRFTINYSGVGRGMARIIASPDSLTGSAPGNMLTLDHDTIKVAALQLNARNIYGNTFNGSADVTTRITATYLPTTVVYNDQTNNYPNIQNFNGGLYANTWTGGAAIHFNNTGEPSSINQGDFWYTPGADEFRYRASGVTRVLATLNGTQTITNKDFTSGTNIFPSFGSTNLNIGSGYRWAIPGSNNIKTSFYGWGILADSSTNTNGITAKIDSATLSTKYVRSNDSTLAARITANTTSIALKNNISDTSAMLSKYLRKSDTSAMLSSYGSLAKAVVNGYVLNDSTYRLKKGDSTNIDIPFTSPAGTDSVKLSNDSLYTYTAGVRTLQGTISAGTLTGSTLASNVTTASITTLTAPITSGTWRGDPIDPVYRMYAALGGAIKGKTNGDRQRVTITTTFTSGQGKWVIADVPQAATITGVNWLQVVQGVYNVAGAGYNGIVIFSINTATGDLTQIGKTTDDSTIWKTPTSNSWGTKAFSSPISVAAGEYMLELIFNATGTPGTAPSYGCTSNSSFSNNASGFPNSMKMAGTTSSETTAPTTKAMSSITAALQNPYAEIY